MGNLPEAIKIVAVNRLVVGSNPTQGAILFNDLANSFN